MNSPTRYAPLAAALALLWACSGGAPSPPELEDTTDSPVAMPEQGSATMGTEASCDEGATSRCMAPTAYENGGYVACRAGTKTCSKGRWTACTAHAAMPADPEWAATDVGCAWPQQACKQEDSYRTCRKELAPTSYTANCTVVTEVCFGGTWLPCSAETAPAR